MIIIFRLQNLLVLKSQNTLPKMFGLFKKKTELEKLQDNYKKLMEEAYKLQSVNRSDSDQKYLEADNLLKKIEALQAK